MFIGIDQSIKETAITVLFSPKHYSTYSIKGKGMSTSKKVEYIYQKSRALIKKILQTNLKVNPQDKEVLCYIEGGSFSSTGRLFSLGQISGLFLAVLLEHKIAYREIAPSSLKKFMTGRGSADKKYMIECLRQKYDQTFTNDNKADSYALAMMAYRECNESPFREELEVLADMKVVKKKKSRPRYRRKTLEF